jgi:DNA polymerase I-like protein with 3'-5' exonuclease and polymerase domains
LVPAWLGHIQLAVKIAKDGFEHRAPRALCDPTPAEFALWAAEYLAAPHLFRLALDIETKSKRDLGEDELDLGDTSYAIERISFAYKLGEGCSVPWSPEYLDTAQALIEAAGVKLIWNRAFDKPRIEAQGWKFGGPVWDTMFMWHVLQARLPKSINFVSPLVIPHYPRWKFMSEGEPAYYSAVDSAALYDITEYLVPKLIEQDQWEYFLTKTHETTDALEEMEAGGVPIDSVARFTVAKYLSDKQRTLQGQMETIIPAEIRKYDPKAGFVRTPADTTNLVTLDVAARTKVCSVCGLVGATKTKHTTRKRDNPCHGAAIVEETRTVTRFARLDHFVPSNLRMQEYQTFHGHENIVNDEGSVTYDAHAITRLVKKYPADLLYPLVAEYRGAEKLQTYTGSVDVSGLLQGGWPVDSVGFIHPHFGHNPSTGRLSCSNPNLQNIPRAEEEDDDASLIKSLFVPLGGCVIVEVDYAAIEALLLGYFARDPFYMRLARLGVHDYVNAKSLLMAGRIKDDPSPSWSDADLKLLFGDLKERFKVERTAIKKVVYTSNYGGTAYKIYMDDPAVFGGEMKRAHALQRDYFTTFPSIGRYQWATVEEVGEKGYLRGCWGLINRFYKVFRWKKTDQGKWKRELGDEAKEALAFKPQHAAAGLMKNAIITARRENPDLFKYLRLTIHDSLYTPAVPKAQLDTFVAWLKEIMERPAACMPCHSSWGMGEFLSVAVEAKVSEVNWAKVDKWKAKS